MSTGNEGTEIAGNVEYAQPGYAENYYQQQTQQFNTAAPKGKNAQLGRPARRQAKKVSSTSINQNLLTPPFREVAPLEQNSLINHQSITSGIIKSLEIDLRRQKGN
jgi:hypothetical protein